MVTALSYNTYFKMSENTENTLSAYLGHDFQIKLMWQLLVEPEFAEKVLPNLAIEYFDDPNLKRLYVIILEYYQEFGKVPNLQNQSIQQAINQYKTPNNSIEEESLFSVLKRVELWNERVLNKEMLHDGAAIQSSTNEFIKQQEYRKLGEHILEKTKNGEIRKKQTLGGIEDKIQKISHIGDDEDYGIEVIDGIDRALRKEFRQTIPTGVDVIDALTGGGLGKSEIGVILTPSGVGKTTLLTKIANTGYEIGKNVAQIVFEDTAEQIQRKHFTIWSGVPLSKMDIEEENAKANRIAHAKAEELKGKGHLIIKKFSQENTTMMDIRNWIIRYQKKWGYKFDLVVLDYLDCLESHKKTTDRTEAEFQIIKSFEAMAADFDIPAWTAIQTNRSGFDAEFVEAYQTGGSIKRIHKAHFFMSVAKTPDQKEANLANIRIIKARFAQDGQTFRDCIFNNDTMQIIIEDDRYKFSRVNKYTKHLDETDVENIEKQATKVSAQQVIAEKISERYDQIIEKANINTIIEPVKDITEHSPTEINDLLKKNAELLVDTNTEITNKHIEDIKTDIDKDILKRVMTDDKLLEIDETATIIEKITESDTIIPVQPLSEPNGLKITFELNKKESFGWNGQSGKTENEIINQSEIKLEDIKTETIPKSDEINRIVREYSPPKTENTEQKIPLTEKFETKINVKEEEKKLIINPDSPQNGNKSIQEMLAKLRKNQDVIKKE